MNRARVRLGRRITYYPTDAQVATVSGSAGETWPAAIAKVNADGTVTLNAVRSNGTELAVTSVPQGQAKGAFSLLTAA